MKKIALVFIAIALVCSCNNATKTSGTTQTGNKLDSINDDAFKRDLAASELEFAFEILQSSNEYKADTDGLREAIIANGGTGFTIMLEGSPNGEFDGATQSDIYIFALREEYEERSTVTNRYAYNPKNKQLLKYDGAKDEYYQIEFDKSLIEY